MANVFDEHGNLITGAGGGQADEVRVEPKGTPIDLTGGKVDTGPVDAPGPLPSASDLHRWYCGPWCKKCGFVLGASGDDCERIDCPHDFKPGLHSRDPRTKVEGLECGKHWYFEGGDWVTDALAADLLVMGVVKVWMHKDYLEAIGAAVDDLYAEVTLPEAIAITYQRKLDAEEQG